MLRRAVWPDFRPDHVLYTDADVCVVHKPAGCSSQAADAERPDDLVTRLGAYFEEKGESPYLGTHQRLDRETSGAILFTRRTSANAAIAAAFEGRTVEKRYLAAVRGWPERRKTATLDDRLRKVGDRMEVVRGKHVKDGQRAVTQVRVVERRQDRALLELSLETGRMHQARVQLAAAGAPIAGDALYGGPLAPRLMLHAAQIAIPKRLRVIDGDDAALRAWVRDGDRGVEIYDDDRALERALALSVERRWGLGRSADRDAPDRKTTAFRLVNEEGDALPGLAVDVYGDHLVAQLYVSETWTDSRRARVLDRLAALGFDGVYLKLRPRQSNVLVETRREDLAPSLPVRGTAADAEILVHEEGMPIAVRLGDGLSTGIFLDQRKNRRMVREISRGLRVANLFSYTCGFSVAAAAGGARETVSVDASVAALERGRAAFTLAGLDPKAHKFVAEDAFSWLARTAKKGEKFDLVVVDPPSYATTKKRRFVAESDYGELVELVTRVLAPAGKIVACCNHRGILRAKLRRMCGEGVRAAGRELIRAKDLREGSDYPPALGREPNMKSLLLEVV